MLLTFSLVYLAWVFFRADTVVGALGLFECNNVQLISNEELCLVVIFEWS